jgi:hypothetical protein
MNLYKHCPDLPIIPEELANLITEESARRNQSEFTARDGERYEVPWYSLHKCEEDVVSFLRPYFSKNTEIKIQLMTRELLIHKDQGRVTAYNYLIKSGGDVSTVWFDDEKNEIDRVILPERAWYKLDVGTFHNIYNITSTRIAITAFEVVETE